MLSRATLILLAATGLLGCQGAAGANNGGNLPRGLSSGGATFEQDGNANDKKVISGLNSDQIYATLTMGTSDSDPAVNLEDRINRLGNLDFIQFVKAVEKAVVNDSLTLDGTLAIAGAKTKFIAAMPKIQALAFKWGTFANYWRAQGLNPKTLMQPEVQAAVGRAARYFNVPERQANPKIEQANLQDEIDRINAERAVGTVSRMQNSNCDKFGQPKCTPDPITMDSIKTKDISFESCMLPSGLKLKHLCTQAAAVGGGMMMADRRLEPVGAVIAAAALICVAESTAPVAFACMPGNTFSSDPTF